MDNAFEYRHGQLCCEAVPLERLAAQFGTPLYVYSQTHILQQYRSLDRAWAGVEHLICYAVKANSNLAILRLLADAGAGFDIVSGGELYRICHAGGNPRRCLFAGVGKTADEIAYALQQGIYCFNVESEPELQLISSVANRLRRTAPIALRINPGVDPQTHHYVATGKLASKFGIPLGRALAVYREAVRLPRLQIRGIQMHIGSQITTPAPYVLALKKLLPLVERVRALAPDTLEFLDIGGGFGIRYHRERPASAADFAHALQPYLQDLKLRVVLEPGRYIVGNAGVLLTRVLYVKHSGAKTFVIVDAAMNDLIRPALYGSYHEIRPVRKPGRTTFLVDVVGPVCESGDFFAQQRRIPVVAAGDLLAIMSAGAYAQSMASNYNSRPRPAEVLVTGRQAKLVRRRETWPDLVRGE